MSEEGIVPILERLMIVGSGSLYFLSEGVGLLEFKIVAEGSNGTLYFRVRLLNFKVVAVGNGSLHFMSDGVGVLGFKATGGDGALYFRVRVWVWNSEVGNESLHFVSEGVEFKRVGSGGNGSL